MPMEPLPPEQCASLRFAELEGNAYRAALGELPCKDVCSPLACDCGENARMERVVVYARELKKALRETIRALIATQESRNRALADVEMLERSIAFLETELDSDPR